MLEIVFIFFFQIIYIQSALASPGELKAVPLSNRPTAVLGSNTSLACSASVKPILCLWKTPYGHVYTLSEGVFAESGRLKHEVPSEAGGQGCGIQIVGVENRDQVNIKTVLYQLRVNLRLCSQNEEALDN